MDVVTYSQGQCISFFSVLYDVSVCYLYIICSCSDFSISFPLIMVRILCRRRYSYRCPQGNPQHEMRLHTGSTKWSMGAQLSGPWADQNKVRAHIDLNIDT